MNRKKIIITINIVLLLIYIVAVCIVIFKYSDFPSQYEKIENEYVEKIETKLNSAFLLDEKNMIKALEEIQEEYPMEIIVEEKGTSIYRSIELIQQNSYINSLDSSSVLYEMQGYIDTNGHHYFVWFSIYHLANDYYLIQFINQQNILFLIAFIVLLITIFIVQWILVRPLLKISESVKKASEYQFDEIATNKTDDNVNKDFGKFVTRLRGSISAVSRKHTELESQLQYGRERLNNTIVVSKALVHDLKSPVHQLLIENEYRKEHITKENTQAQEIAEYNIRQTEDILLNVNGILKMINNNYNVLEEIEMFDIVQMTVETTNLFRASLMDKELYFSLDAPEQLRVRMNKVNMKLLIHNIISNAYQYAKRDSEINFKIELVKNQLIIECKNKSDLEDIERMNKSEELFNVVTNQNQNNVYSSGNGLFLIKDLTAMFDGVYQAKANKDQVTIKIDIPVKVQGKEDV